MAMIPALVGSSLVAIQLASGSGSAGHSGFAESWRWNMMMAHASAIVAASDGGLVAGRLSQPERWPFRNIDDWRSELVVDGDRTVLLTWSATNDVPAGGLDAMLPLLDRLAGEAIPVLGHFGGRFAFAGDGGCVVGVTPVPVPASAISAGTLVVGSWIR